MKCLRQASQHLVMSLVRHNPLSPSLFFCLQGRFENNSWYKFGGTSKLACQPHLIIGQREADLSRAWPHPEDPKFNAVGSRAFILELCCEHLPLPLLWVRFLNERLYMARVAQHVCITTSIHTCISWVWSTCRYIWVAGFHSCDSSRSQHVVFVGNLGKFWDFRSAPFSPNILRNTNGTQHGVTCCLHCLSGSASVDASAGCDGNMAFQTWK